MQPITDYPVVKKFDMSVALNLTEEFRSAKWEKENRIIPLGEDFSKNAESVTRHLFSRVVVINDERSQEIEKFDALLTPKMVFVDQTSGVTVFHEAVLTATLEWTLKDVKGDILWIDSVRGEGRANEGNMFTRTSNFERRIKALHEDLFRKTFQAMEASHEIRQFANEN
ncbi:hypothetical protein [Candidatus Nitronereus thalassa]|uniref:Uncharacterized protein n=1 Tax=Candidatus Nitronereus thalassa TaxID=3020898 RepID=A0ABU3KCV6_9BACT|nr:hypothetical protein [Candidatus Nitronereus thalassa]MDT7044299.1 hypothetical protein [Candidatus Nitronereus thalassa]